jgi:hypothetical protein
MLEARSHGDLVSTISLKRSTKLFSYPQAAGRLPHLCADMRTAVNSARGALNFTAKGAAALRAGLESQRPWRQPARRPIANPTGGTFEPLPSYRNGAGERTKRSK